MPGRALTLLVDNSNPFYSNHLPQLRKADRLLVTAQLQRPVCPTYRIHLSISDKPITDSDRCNKLFTSSTRYVVYSDSLNIKEPAQFLFLRMAEDVKLSTLFIHVHQIFLSKCYIAYGEKSN
ncbi:hypothetical protein J6590_013767 [Homalodisca vitripennis]|nr:hypothetical protein J6590_013767 [Homalodisca vitripennis]